ncbi:MAG: hypothetical protein QXQ30_01300 [Candidatus Pacearchaeota archaeon]
MRKAIFFLFFLFIIIAVIFVGCKKAETDWDKDFEEIEKDLQNLEVNISESEITTDTSFDEIDNLISQT